MRAVDAVAASRGSRLGVSIRKSMRKPGLRRNASSRRDYDYRALPVELVARQAAVDLYRSLASVSAVIHAQSS